MISRKESHNVNSHFATFRRWLSEKLELSRGSNNLRNLRPMEGLRGFAAFLVFAYHYLHFVVPYIEHAPGLTRILGSVGQLGNAGVDLFFVLSGYLIYGSLISRQQNFGAYLLRRLTRIYPVFLVMLLIYIGLSYAVPSVNRIPSSLPDAIAYLTANLLLLGPLIVPVWPLIPVTWSLSYEMFYYAIMPLLVTGVNLRQRSFVWRVAFFVIIASLYFLFCIFFTGQSRLLMFVAGILLYEILTHTRARAPGVPITLLTCTAGFTVYILLFNGRTDVPLNTLALFISFFALCFHCFSRQDSWLRRLFEWTPLRWFGNMSYSFYMTHILSMRIFALLLPSIKITFAGSAPLILLGFLPLFFVAALVPAFMMYILVEKPFSLAKSTQRTSRKVPA